jgi:PPOX class probable F420-dependent enzyme
MADAMSIPSRAADILASKPIGYLSTQRPDGRMSVVPVAVIWDGQTVRISTVKSTKKVRNLRLDPRLTLCVPHPSNPQQYVELRGTADIADDTDRSFVNAMARDWMGLEEYPYDRPGDDRVIITLRVEAVSSPAVHGADA